MRYALLKADLGAATTTYSLLIIDPIEDSFIRGTLNVLRREDVAFEARVDTPSQVTVLGVTIVVKVDVPAQAFVGSTELVERMAVSTEESTTVVRLG